MVTTLMDMVALMLTITTIIHMLHLVGLHLLMPRTTPTELVHTTTQPTELPAMILQQPLLIPTPLSRHLHQSMVTLTTGNIHLNTTILLVPTTIPTTHTGEWVQLLLQL